MSPLQHFTNIFPDHHLIPLPDELRYFLPTRDCALAYEHVARQVILSKGLPLTAAIETWESGGYVREIAVVVREVPEEDVVERNCPDEVQDGDLF